MKKRIVQKAAETKKPENILTDIACLTVDQRGRRTFVVVEIEGENKKDLETFTSKSAAELYMSRLGEKKVETPEPQLSTAPEEKIEPKPDLATRGNEKIEEKEPKETREKAYTRMQAFGDAYRKLNDKGFTKKQIIEETDKLFQDQGGDSNIKESGWNVNYGLRAAEALGLTVNVKAEE